MWVVIANVTYNSDEYPVIEKLEYESNARLVYEMHRRALEGDVGATVIIAEVKEASVCNSQGKFE